MSLVRCERCSALVDSDFDPDCFTEEGNGPIYCEPCREECPAPPPSFKFDRIAAAEFTADDEVDNL